MGNNLEKIFSLLKNPLYQVAMLLSFSLLINCFTFLINITGITEIDPVFYWRTTCALLLFYAVYNSISSIVTENLAQYWSKSMISFMLLAVVGGAMSRVFSGIEIFEAGSYSWIYIVIAVVYFIFLAMVQTMRQIVNFAQKEEWSQPRKRNR